MKSTMKYIKLVVAKAIPELEYYPTRDTVKAECTVCGYVTYSTINKGWQEPYDILSKYMAKLKCPNKCGTKNTKEE